MKQQNTSLRRVDTPPKPLTTKQQPRKQRPLITAVRSRAGWLSMVTGVSIVAIWTVLRHITNGINFDVVGQIGVAEQWSHGLHSSVTLGTTSYVLKMPLYMLMQQLSFISPMNQLLLLALLCNIATFVGIWVVATKTLQLYSIQARGPLYAGMLWLATMCGNVFWVDYANSRNIEVVGGLVVAYLVLRILQTSGRRSALALSAVAMLVFFADPLQLYVVGIGSGIACGIWWLRRPSWKRFYTLVTVASGLFVGALGARLLAWGSSHLLHITYLQAPQTPLSQVLAQPAALGKSLLTTTATIFGADFFQGAASLNSLREAINASLLVITAVVIIRYTRRSRRVVGLMFGTIIVTNYLIYIASGQALAWATARYLIMVPLCTIIWGVCVASMHRSKLTRLGYVWLVGTAVSGLLLAGALATQWPHRHSKDTHIYATTEFMKQYDYRFGLSSREVGITTTYFSNHQAIVLPMACSATHQLSFTNLFYDSAGFNRFIGQHGLVPIIIPTGGITFGSTTCTEAQIVLQFGAPVRTFSVASVGSVLLYPTDTIRGVLQPTVEHARTAPAPLVTPEPIAQLASSLAPLTSCTAGTVDIVVAHPDDDILFMNPALSETLQHSCVRTIYMTAADDGRPPEYWLQRQVGIKSAYAAMLGVENNWLDSTASIGGHSVVVSTLPDRPSVAMMFINLPDGNVTGDGFVSTGNMSLAKLSSGEIDRLASLDGQSTYSHDDLVAILRTIIEADRPTSVFTHMPDGPASDGDHSDHRQTGQVVRAALEGDSAVNTLEFYIGYPSNALAPNLPPDVAAQKKDTFYTYAHEDNAICASTDSCSEELTYQRYFSRSYHTTIVRNVATTLPAPKQIIVKHEAPTPESIARKFFEAAKPAPFGN